MRYPLVSAEAEAARGIWTLHEDRRGEVWAGTDRGLFRYDRAADGFTRRFVPPAEVRPAPVVLALREARDGTVWAAPLTGCSAWTRGPAPGKRASTAMACCASLRSTHALMRWVFYSRPGPTPSIAGCLTSPETIQPFVSRTAMRGLTRAASRP